MRVEFDKDGVLNIIPESNVESMAIELFVSKGGEVLYHSCRFDHDGSPYLELKQGESAPKDAN